MPSRYQVHSLKLFRDPFSEVFTWFALILVNQKKRTKLPLMCFSKCHYLSMVSLEPSNTALVQSTGQEVGLESFLHF